MSNYHVNLVNRAELSDIDKTKWAACKNVLRAIADHANEAEADMAWPGVDLLMLETGCSRSVISKTTTLLAKHGWISKKRRSDASNIYRINVKKLRDHQVDRGDANAVYMAQHLPGMEFADEAGATAPRQHKSARTTTRSGTRRKSKQGRAQGTCQIDTSDMSNRYIGHVDLTHRTCQIEHLTLIELSRNPQPTSARAGDESGPAAVDHSGDGWLDHDQAGKNGEHGSTPSESATAATGVDQQADTAGTRLLRELPLPQGSTPLTRNAVTKRSEIVDRALSAGHSPVALIQRLTNGLNDARNPAGVVWSRLGELAAELDHATQRQTRPDVPDWCGRCGTHYPDARAKKNPKFRKLLNEDGESERQCPTCHPRAQPVPA